MPVAMDRLKSELGGLTPLERAELAHFLLESLDDAPSEADSDIEAAWSAELGRRVDEIERGVAEGKPAEQLFDELRKKYS